MIPQNISREHVIKALDEIRKNGVSSDRQSKGYYIVTETGDKFPPKYVLSIANKYANGEELDPSKFTSGKETNNYLINLGFQIEEKNEEPNMRMIDAIVELYKKNNNGWLDYNEIYERMNQSLFGPNKHGERGKRNIVYRLLLGYADLFEVDEKFRPKKFRLSLENNEQQNIEIKKKYSTGGLAALYLNNEVYFERIFDLEKDFEDEVKENYKLIFGENSYYYDVRKKIGARICDAFVFDEELGKVIVVENELFSHDLWGHIIPQIIEFFNGMNNEETKFNLKYKVEWADNHKLPIIEAIDKNNYEIMVVIDRIDFNIKKAKQDINELLKHFVKNKNIEILFKEFKVFTSPNGQKIYQVV